MTITNFLGSQETWANAIVGFRLLPKPVIAAVNGAAAGAGSHSHSRLPRIVGLGHASEILLTGRFVDSEEAARIGLVNRVVPAEQLRQEAVALAASITANSPLGLRLTKQVIQVNVDAPSLRAALETENRNQALASHTDDMAEALQAFLERRAPTFTGH